MNSYLVLDSLNGIRKGYEWMEDPLFIYDRATRQRFALWRELDGDHLEYFNCGSDCWCTEDDNDLCDDDCDTCALCCNYGDPEAKCRAFADYIASKGCPVSRNGYRRSGSRNLSSITAHRMED